MNEEMNITSAQYVQDNGINSGIKATIDGKVWFVGLGLDSRYYAEIMRQVKAGTLTIQDAD